MNDVIHLHELQAYQRASVKKNSVIYKSRNWRFQLSRLPTEGVRNEFYAFIMERGKVLKITSIRSEIWQFGVTSRFLTEIFCELTSLLFVVEEVLVKEFRKWLLKNKYSITTRRYKRELANYSYQECDNIRYLRKIYRFLEPQDDRNEIEKGIWELNKLPIKLNINPILNPLTLNFTRISQVQMRKEVQQTIYERLKNKALGTVQAEINALNRFSSYLSGEYDNIQSLKQLKREHIESYLEYIATRANERKSYRSDLCHLKSVLALTGKMINKRELCKLFLTSDIPREPIRVYRSYSDEELLRLNSKIVEGDAQVARAIMIHQMIGTRISDTLTLLEDCISVKESKYLLTINQVKSKRTYEKTVNEDVVRLLRAAIKHTKEKFPDAKYIFVNEDDITRPMTYAKIQYHLMLLIQVEDLRDDSGELFGVGTHMFRHSYGRKLTEMHVDDITIARLLGHANVSSVKYYRRMGDMLIAGETRETREEMNEILKQLIKRW